MKITAEDAARLIGGTITGDSKAILTGVARIEQAEKGDLTFLYHPSYEKYFKTTKATAILVKPGFDKSRDDITYIEVDSPEKAFGNVIIQQFKPSYNLSGIDETAFIHEYAEAGDNLVLGRNVIISSGCKIGNNVKIFHNTVILDDVEIGDDTLIFQNVSIREKTIIGKRNVIHAGAVIGSDGFGFNTDESGAYHKIPQLGNVILKDDVEIGSGTTIDRAALGSTIIGARTKLDNLVQIGHNVVIGEDTVISGQAGISGSTKIGNKCMLAGQVGIAGHITIGDEVVLLAKSGVSKSLLKPGYYFGIPAKELKVSYKLEAHIRNLPDYFSRLTELEKEVKRISNLSKAD